MPQSELYNPLEQTNPQDCVCQGCAEIFPDLQILVMCCTPYNLTIWLCERCAEEAYERIKKVLTMSPLDDILYIHRPDVECPGA